MNRQLALLLVAIQFLTRLPVPSPAGFETHWLSKSIRYFPLVGALVGIINVCVWWLTSQVFPSALAIALMMAASLLVTGALHEDGIADVCDGFGGGHSRDDVLRIMKDSRIGAYGAVGVFAILSIKWVTLTALDVSALPITVIAGHVVSRWCATGLIWRLSYVREDASAKSKPLADGLSFRDWLLSALLGALAIAGCVAVAPSIDPKALGALIAGCGVAIVIAIFASVYFKGRIGGYTGDCLGATQQLAEVGFYLTALAALRPASFGG